ncbi:MAG TPA: hypothetical protein VN726_05135 [Hanamia sp.]|nr:hypothetical protein [Hanamia sp.]
MKPLLQLKHKRIALLSAFLLIISFNAAAQEKSVYDVIPGSGPRKKQPSKSVVVFRDKKAGNSRNTYPVYTHKRKNLPPGQAKKVYGGSAKDYAPGQVKKHRHHREWNGGNGKNKHHKNHGKYD